MFRHVRPIFILFLSIWLASCASGPTPSDTYRSPAARGQSCHQLMSNIWESTADGVNQARPDPIIALRELLELDEGHIQTFIARPDTSQRELSQLFNRQVATQLESEQVEYAAGLTILLQRRHPDLNPRQIIKQYQKLMRSCINT